MESTDERLITAAAEVFAERGYDGAGVAEIARRAGVTTGAIYSRYRGKSELLFDVLDSRVGDHLESILSSSEHNSPADLLSTLGSHLLDQHGDEDPLFLEAVVASRRDSEMSEMMSRKLEDEGMGLAKIIEEAKSDGQIDNSIDTASIVTFAQAISLGFTIFRTLDTPTPAPDEWQVVIDRVISSALPTTVGDK
ncbi:MAG: helix-turn-helix domain containing protein [Acidimicrobiales bacterium]|jgi:AcrR family transcriptional regulator|nr:TetR/AcrR family transcriptional regulator [Acidimicrobiales bacterium]MDG1845255.1 helix-turn-helix domain containing protein [Acidimicrobiales bacterium]